MAKKQPKAEEEVIKDTDTTLVVETVDEGETTPEPELKIGVIKTYTQNGLGYKRIRHEDGRIEDIRI